MISVVFFRPDQPGNTGAAFRLSSCFNVPVHIVHPCGFPFSAKELKRSGMDYLPHVQLTEHDDFATFLENKPAGRIVLLTVNGSCSHTDFQFQENDFILIGRESAGVPPEVAAACDAKIRIPLQPNFRSLNAVHALAIGMSEALRQTNGFYKANE